MEVWLKEGCDMFGDVIKSGSADNTHGSQSLTEPSEEEEVEDNRE